MIAQNGFWYYSKIMKNEKIGDIMLSQIEKDEKYGAHNYKPLPIVIAKGKGEYLWDIEGNQYVDLMSAYSAVSLGHSHPKIVKEVIAQVKTLAVTSRALYNNRLPELLEKLHQLTGFDKTIPMNSGAEAVETAMKLARKWAYQVKKIPYNQAIILACENNFHGRTLGVISMSTEAQTKEDFGPLLPGISVVRYDDIDALENEFIVNGANIAAFIVEPIQGEAGIVTPSAGYLKNVRQLCTHYNVLMITDEIQTGLMRTGKLFCYMHDDITPDLVIMGKALGGGVLPVSAVSGIEEVLGLFKPGDHGSTFGGNPLAAQVACKSLELLSDPKLEQRVQKLGDKAIEYLKKELKNCSVVKDIRGKGLFIGIEFYKPLKAKEIVIKLLEEKIIAKDTHEQTIRIAPPLIIKEKVLMDCLKIMVDIIKSY